MCVHALNVINAMFNSRQLSTFMDFRTETRLQVMHSSYAGDAQQLCLLMHVCARAGVCVYIHATRLLAPCEHINARACIRIVLHILRDFAHWGKSRTHVHCACSQARLSRARAVHKHHASVYLNKRTTEFSRVLLHGLLHRFKLTSCRGQGSFHDQCDSGKTSRFSCCRTKPYFVEEEHACCRITARCDHGLIWRSAVYW